jgi:hypothetical protein
MKPESARNQVLMRLALELGSRKVGRLPDGTGSEFESIKVESQHFENYLESIQGKQTRGQMTWSMLTYIKWTQILGHDNIQTLKRRILDLIVTLIEWLEDLETRGDK